MVCQNGKKHRLLKPALIVAAVGVLSIALLYAAEIDHHGMAVESEGSAADCLKCHAKSSSVKSHKILVRYPPPGRGNAFKPLAVVLKAGIKFENGMVTCISCHDLNNNKKNHFAIDTNTSGYAQKLCYVCHLDIG